MSTTTGRAACRFQQPAFLAAKLHHSLTLKISVSAQILYVHIRSEPRVVCQVPSVMIRIFIDHYVIAVPLPSIGKSIIIRCDAEVETSESESFAVSASQMPDMSSTKPSGEVSMFPGMIHAIVRIIAPGIVSHPLPVRMHVWRAWMPLPIVVRSIFLRGMRIFFHWRRSMPRNVLVLLRRRMSVTFLRQSRNAEHQQGCQPSHNCSCCFHLVLHWQVNTSPNSWLYPVSCILI